MRYRYLLVLGLLLGYSVSAEWTVSLTRPANETVLDPLIDALLTNPGVGYVLRDDRAGVPPKDRASDAVLQIQSVLGAEDLLRVVLYETSFGTIREERMVPAKVQATAVAELRTLLARDFYRPRDDLDTLTVAVHPVEGGSLPADERWLIPVVHNLICQRLGELGDFAVLQRRFMERPNLDAQVDPNVALGQSGAVIRLQATILATAKQPMHLRLRAIGYEEELTIPISLEDATGAFDQVLVWLGRLLDRRLPSKIDRSSEAQLLYDRAIALRREHRYDDALAAAEAAFMLNSRDANIRMTLAYALLRACTVDMGMKEASTQAEYVGPKAGMDYQRCLNRIRRALALTRSCRPASTPPSWPWAWSATRSVRAAAYELQQRQLGPAGFYDEVSALCHPMIDLTLEYATELAGQTEYQQYQVRRIFGGVLANARDFPASADYHAAVSRVFDYWQRYCESEDFRPILEVIVPEPTLTYSRIRADLELQQIVLAHCEKWIESPNPAVRLHGIANRMALERILPKGDVDARYRHSLALLREGNFPEDQSANYWRTRLACALWLLGREAGYSSIHAIEDGVWEVVAEMCERGIMVESAFAPILTRLQMRPSEAAGVPQLQIVADMVESKNWTWLTAEYSKVSKADFAETILQLAGRQEEIVERAWSSVTRLRQVPETKLADGGWYKHVPNAGNARLVRYNAEGKEVHRETWPMAPFSWKMVAQGPDGFIPYSNADAWYVDRASGETRRIFTKLPGKRIHRVFFQGERVFVACGPDSRFGSVLKWAVAGPLDGSNWQLIEWPAHVKNFGATHRYGDWWIDDEQTIWWATFVLADKYGELWRLPAGAKEMSLAMRTPQSRRAFRLPQGMLLEAFEHPEAKFFMLVNGELVMDHPIIEALSRVREAGSVVWFDGALWATGQFGVADGRRVRIARLAEDGTPTFYKSPGGHFVGALEILDGQLRIGDYVVQP